MARRKKKEGAEWKGVLFTQLENPDYKITCRHFINDPNSNVMICRGGWEDKPLKPSLQKKEKKKECRGGSVAEKER